ncbi:PREDICTED: acyl-CoA synthetase family member 4-like [Amphimedon queenslandica]|uniref:Pyrrolo-quinoline quinone repeat domain-containing protein n=1 Tax=Amphimedon queenslandica TaxID=400682 RepID=A0AAN0JHN6_AMPQE|nr:PREDICTED: acyl-CoA synthetase family member 4-like [Amphimedon queenslandica]|eukprot:XP_019856550.1 PREDICTED: acyl-CoA synthetase family member 4-like [Amphimedon queenslandica]
MGGVIKWRKQLRGRVESSLCVSYCGEYVIAGSYDGCLYVLHSLSGSIHWCFTTKGSLSEDPIKSSPIAHPVTGYIWFGSHDHHLYTVDICVSSEGYQQNYAWERRCVHAIHLGGGAIFSSVTFSRDVSTAIVATLQGKILCIDTDNGDILWEYSCPRPVFATPTVLPNDDIICGCVNGSLYVLSSDGKLVTELTTEGPVFTSSIVAVTTTLPTHPNEFFIFSGSHDKSMYCWKSGWSPEENKHTYDLKWKVALNGEIYSIGMLSKSHMINTLCTCTAKGTIYILSPDSGRILTCHNLPNQIFSSPVFIESCILVGCRDDGLHCLSLVMAGE